MNKRLNAFSTEYEYNEYISSGIMRRPHVAFITDNNAILYVESETLTVTVGEDGNLAVNRPVSLSDDGVLSFGEGTELNGNGVLKIK